MRIRIDMRSIWRINFPFQSIILPDFMKFTRFFCLQNSLKKLYFQNNVKVAVAGASGGIGQPLSLLLKQSPLVTELSLYDIVHTPGVAADLSHIDTPAKVQGFNGAENLETALKNADVVIIPAGVPRKPGR